MVSSGFLAWWSFSIGPIQAVASLLCALGTAHNTVPLCGPPPGLPLWPCPGPVLRTVIVGLYLVSIYLSGLRFRPAPQDSSCQGSGQIRLWSVNSEWAILTNQYEHVRLCVNSYFLVSSEEKKNFCTNFACKDNSLCKFYPLLGIQHSCEYSCCKQY